MLLKNKSAIITGATDGIGKEIAINFAKNGASVAIIGRSETKAKEVISEIKNLTKNTNSNEIKVIYKIVDVSKREEVENAFLEILSENGFENIDILVNNAGITKDNLLLKMKDDDLDEVLNINLKSCFYTCKALYRKFLKQKSGKIINISSVVAITGNAGQTNYCASKAAMIGFTKALAKELASRNICVNSIAPGFIETKMTQDLKEMEKQKLIDSIPLKKMGKPSDIANTALFLASHLSNYITGQTIVVDGGMVM
jgi:3-oxoacyl-[acyl-carrier protein] reductase